MTNINATIRAAADVLTLARGRRLRGEIEGAIRLELNSTRIRGGGL